MVGVLRLCLQNTAFGEGGCIGGNATINNQKTAKKLIDNFTQNSEDIPKI